MTCFQIKSKQFRKSTQFSGSILILIYLINIDLNNKKSKELRKSSIFSAILLVDNIKIWNFEI